MSGSESFAVILRAVRGLNGVGSWTGKTHVIKSLYIASTRARLPFEFVLFKHGPYSFDLNDAIESMSAVELLDVQSTPPYGVKLAPGRMEAAIDPALEDEVSQAVDQAVGAVGCSEVKELEAFATSIWVAERGQTTQDEAAWLRAVKELKPHLDDRMVTEAIKKAKDWLNPVTA
ncbi:MAG: hypothetical protein AMXMBFR81_18520 [Chthonomonas sp.]